MRRTRANGRLQSGSPETGARLLATLQKGDLDEEDLALAMYWLSVFAGYESLAYEHSKCLHLILSHPKLPVADVMERWAKDRFRMNAIRPGLLGLFDHPSLEFVVMLQPQLISSELVDDALAQVLKGMRDKLPPDVNRTLRNRVAGLSAPAALVATTLLARQEMAGATVRMPSDQVLWLAKMAVSDHDAAKLDQMFPRPQTPNRRWRR